MMYDRIVLDNVTYRYQNAQQPVLDAASYTFERGASYAICGQSGAGKSTLVHLIAQFLDPLSGAIFTENTSQVRTNIAHIHDWRTAIIGIVFQQPHLIETCSVLDNVLLKAYIQGRPFEDAKREALQLLEMFGIAQMAAKYPATLSGGEQQRVAVARALLGAPQFVLLDEPTAHADAATKTAILDGIVALQQTTGAGILMVTHDSACMARMDHVAFLRHGTLQNESAAHVIT